MNWTQRLTNEEETERGGRFLGHSCFELTEGDTRVLIDPFLTGNPKAAVEASELDPTHVFLTHGHSDHYGDVIDIAKRTSAQAFKADVEQRTGGRITVEVLDPGGTYSL